jgi:predicted Rossmann fold flavoprotein
MEMAKRLAHTIVPCVASLVGFFTEPNHANMRCNGFVLRNINAVIKDSNNKTIAEQFGQAELMDKGVAGPIILTLSRQIARRIAEKEELYLEIDFKPALDEQKIDNKLVRDLSQSNITIENMMRSYLPQAVVALLFQTTKINPSRLTSQITAQDRALIRLFLKHYRLKIIATEGWDRAVITQGGISLKEVDNKTMQSKKVKHLFFAGEVLDLDADTGGYNLQIAFSTGWIAGKQAAKADLS